MEDEYLRTSLFSDGVIIIADAVKLQWFLRDAIVKQDRLSGLKTEIYFLTTLEATGLRPRYQAGWFLLKPLSWVVKDCLLTVSLHSSPSMLVCVLISPSNKDTSHTGLQAKPCDHILP